MVGFLPSGGAPCRSGGGTWQLGRAEYDIAATVRTIGIAWLEERCCRYCGRATAWVLDRCHKLAVSGVAVLGAARADKLPRHCWAGSIRELLGHRKADQHRYKCDKSHADYLMHGASSAVICVSITDKARGIVESLTCLGDCLSLLRPGAVDHSS